MPATVLVVERDGPFADSLCRNLELFGYRQVHAPTGTEALSLAQLQTPALVLLDTALDDMNGLDVCRAVRKWSNVPIIILSSNSEEADRVLGFELGADDYVTKPFSVRELMCRVRAVLRRVWPRPENEFGAAEPVQFGQVNIDPWRKEVTRNGERVSLRPKEYDLLWFLVRNPGHAFKPKALSDLIWEHDHAGSKNALRIHMCMLRDKLEEDPAHPRYLRTIYAGGYVFDPTPDKRLESSEPQRDSPVPAAS